MTSQSNPGTPDPSVPSYLNESLARLRGFEGCVSWMYRDTVGKVTVGVGLMLPDIASAQALPFLNGVQPAAPEQIAAEYNRVNLLPMGRAAAFYKAPASLQLSQQTIDEKLTAVLKDFETSLRAEFPHYDVFPDGVKLALLDMIYNLGPEGLFKGFPHLVTAVQAGNWTQAAQHCMRRGPSPARNAWTREQFLSAALVTIKAEAEHWLLRILRRLRLLFSRPLARRP